MAHPLAGTATLVRLMARLDRLKLTLWLIGLAFIIVMTTITIRDLTETEAATRGVAPEVVLAEQGALVSTNPAMVALSGPADALDTFGGRYAYEIGAAGLVMIALMNILLVVRHTRSEEESGRAELVRAAPVGAWAATAAVMVLALAANLVIAGVAVVAFLADGLAIGPTMLFGVELALCGLVFAAVALVAAQIVEFGRAAVGLSLAVLAVAYTLRAAGDVRGNWLSWLSPIGWAQKINPFGQPRPLAVLVLVVAVLAGVVTAGALVLRRDVGAGLLAQRSGAAAATDGLATPLGLAWRLQRSSLLWWTVGLAFLGAVYGSILSSIGDLIDGNESMSDMVEAMGISIADLRNGFVTMVLSMMALIAGGGLVQSMLKPRGEESSGRAEPLLAGTMPRRRWLGAQLALTTVAAPLFMVASVLGLYGGDALMVGHVTDLGRGLLAGLARVPALWTVTGLGALFYGLRSRLGLGVWVVFALTVIVFLFAPMLQLPDAVINLSPLSHVTHLPIRDQGASAEVVLSVIGLAATAAGIALFERRDLDT